MKAIVILLIIQVLFSCGCASRKHVRKTEEQTKAVKVHTSGERDSFAFERLLDTASQCEQNISLDRIEYYPITYTDSIGNVKQLVKSVTKASKTEKKQFTRKAKVKAVAVKSDSLTIKSDSSAVKRSEAQNKQIKPSSGLWWLLALVLLLLSVVAYIRYKFL